MLVSEFIEAISRYSREEYFSKFGEVEQVLRQLAGSLTWPQLMELWELAAETPIWEKIHILSFCMKVSGDVSYAEKMIEIIQQASDEELGEYNRLSHYCQTNIAVFCDGRLKTAGVENGLLQIYTTLFRSFCRALGIERRNYIPKEERNDNLVFVFTSQVLGMEHAPTKTLLDRCYVLQKYLGKEVFIVNTAMQIPRSGQAPYYDLQEALYQQELSGQSHLFFRGEAFAFHQCEDNMPDLKILLQLVSMVKTRKPMYLLCIGGGDICADICGMFVPQMTVSTVFSKIAASCGEYQLVGGQVTANDKAGLKILGVEQCNVKQTLFTFSFKEQMHQYTRRELEIWDTGFMLLVVGWRLDDEIDMTFLQMLQRVIEKIPTVGVVFMGKFDGFSTKLDAFPGLLQRALYLGMQEDALAVTACCDLYVNPRRQGGGSSAAEALYQGVPVVTLPMGDVAVAVGDDFCVEDYAIMQEQIIRYAKEPAYYQSMAQKARKRAKLLLDSKTAFGDVMQEFERRL